MTRIKPVSVDTDGAAPVEFAHNVNLAYNPSTIRAEWWVIVDGLGAADTFDVAIQHDTSTEWKVHRTGLTKDDTVLINVPGINSFLVTITAPVGTYTIYLGGEERY